MPGPPGVPQRTPLLGSAYTATSPVLANQQCINLYPEIVETKSGKEVGALYFTPGLDLLATAGSGPIKAIHAFGALLFVLSGTTIYSITTGYVVTNVGTATGAGPYVFIDNGSQLVLFDGTSAQISTGGAFSAVSLPFSNPGGAAFLNGFGIASVANDRTFYQSALNDLSSWPALNFSAADATPDGIIAVTQLHNQLVFLKLFHIEFWVNAGNPGVAFQRLGGVLPNYGCLAANSVVTLADRILWLGLGPEGFGVVYEMSGYEPVRRSTHAIEAAIQAYGDLTGAVAFGYQQNGHEFYQISFPTGDATWVLDLTASQQMGGVPMWHQRAAYTGGAFHRHPASVFALWNNKIVVGDYQTGKVYAYNPATLTDAGAQRRWLRSWRADARFEPVTHPIRCLEIEYDAGGGSGTFNLRKSFDAVTWSATQTSGFGSTQRARFNRLGASKRGAQSDWVFELSSTDAAAIKLLGAWMS